jgi:hypothetical protein
VVPLDRLSPFEKGVFGAPRRVFEVETGVFGPPRQVFQIETGELEVPERVFEVEKGVFGVAERVFEVETGVFGPPRRLFQLRKTDLEGSTEQRDFSGAGLGINLGGPWLHPNTDNAYRRQGMAKGSKLSKMAASRLAVSATVTSSASVHGPQIVQTLHPALFPKSPHKSEITQQFVDALGNLLDRAALEVQQADLAHAAELLDDAAPRQHRDDAQAELTMTLLGQREMLSALYGSQTASAYGLSESIPTFGAELLQRGRAVASLLRKTPIAAKPLRTGVTVKASALADELAPRIESLAAALSDVQRESREAQLTLERKSQAAASWENTYQGVTYAFYGLYLLAGRKDLADRIEPTARRRAGLPEDGDQPQPAAGDPPNPSEPTEPAPPVTP